MLRTEDYATHRVLRWLLEGGNEKEMKIKPRFGIVSMLAALVLAALPDRLQADVIRDGDWLQVGGSLRVDVSTAVPLDQKRAFTVDSGSSVKSVSVSGLPSGLKYDAARRTVSGRPTRSGVYYVTVTAKNTGGYAHSLVQEWNVDNSSNGDFDDIDLSSMEVWEDGEYGYRSVFAPGALSVGEWVNDNHDFHVKSMTGLPSGVKLYRNPFQCGSLEGMPTKAGAFRISITDYFGYKARQTVLVQDHGSARFQAVSRYDYRGAAKGSGIYQVGAKISLTVAPKRGYYFAGWYCDSNFHEPFNYGDKDYRNPTQKVVFDWDMAQEQRTAYARFISKGEDSYISIDADETWNVDTTQGSDSFWIDVDSQTVPKLTARGLPSGVKLSGTELVIADTSKLKPGTSVVTLTAKNVSGAMATKVLRIVVPNLQSYVFDGLEYEASYVYRVGESTVCRDCYICSYEGGWTVSASGLPPGLRFEASYGDCQLTGIATKAGVYTVTLTAKRGSWTEKATFTVEVLPFPADAVGSYGGDVGFDLLEEADVFGIGCHISAVAGTFSLTVGKNGKMSVKFPSGSKSVNLSGYSCAVTDEVIYLFLMDARHEYWCDLTIYPKSPLGAYQVEGSIGDYYSEWMVLGQRNVAKTDSQMRTMVTKLSKFGRIPGYAEGWGGAGFISCMNCVVWDYYNMAFTVGLNGMVKASGRIEGRSVSGASQLQVLKNEGGYTLYADFYDYKTSGGLLTYRVIFDHYAVSGRDALCDGSYYLKWGGMACKPVVYLYPETETSCSVKLDLQGKLTCTYPNHGRDGWRDFVASPDGTLTFADGQQFYCLYWEGALNAKWDFSQGYCVKGAETASFLADTLLRMGLTFREANEFIVYWLPLMQDNPYNVITFQGEAYEQAAKLKIEPKPDSVLRIFMAWRPSLRPVAIAAPTLVPFERKGFTVVEWGGMKVGR